MQNEAFSWSNVAISITENTLFLDLTVIDPISKIIESFIIRNVFARWNKKMYHIWNWNWRRRSFQYNVFGILWFRVNNKNAHNPMVQHLLLCFCVLNVLQFAAEYMFATNRSKIKERKSEANLKRWKENTSAASTDPHILTDDKGCGYFKLNFVKQWTMNWFNKIWEKTHNTLMFGLTLHSIM